MWVKGCEKDKLFGALLALASGKAERRQVHPLKAKRCINIVDTPFCYSVGGDGFEPPKA